MNATILKPLLYLPKLFLKILWHVHLIKTKHITINNINNNLNDYYDCGINTNTDDDDVKK